MTTFYYLEMLDRAALCVAAAPEGFDVSMVAPPSPAVNREFYENVGRPWQWTDRLTWSDEQWVAYAGRETIQTWLGQRDGQSVGYFELNAQAHGDVEIAYFGLLPEFIGQGLGGALLSAAVERAWEMAAPHRVWVYTCSDDHPHALGNYRRRGFRLYKTERT
jgi:ribosomal protein S18 acetylase RimI-like enzyme